MRMKVGYFLMTGVRQKSIMLWLCLVTASTVVEALLQSNTCSAGDTGCVSYEWKVTPDGPCKGECPDGFMYLRVECVSSHNFTVPLSAASRLCQGDRPNDIADCTPAYCGVHDPQNGSLVILDYMQQPEVRRIMYIWAVSILFLTTLFFYYILKGVPSTPTDVIYRRRLTYYLNTSTRGTVLEAVNALFSIVSCGLFVYETYNGDNMEETQSALWIYLAELAFSFTFIYSYIIWFYAAERKVRYFFSLLPMVDLVTVPPVLLVLFLSDFVLGQGVGFLRFSRIMKFARVLRLLRILKSVHAASSVTQDAIRSQFVTFVSFCLSLVICTTGFVHYVGNEVEDYPGAWGDHRGPMHFHDALYFTVVSFSLVGYGDVAPRGAVGRLVILVLIAISFLVIPMEMNKLLRLYKMKSQYLGVIELSRRESHILVCCDPSCDGLGDFLTEFFHEDHGRQHTKVCILCPQEPNIAMQELILRFKRVIYLKGDAMLPADLVRASCQSADAVFLLTNQHANKPGEQDSVSVLRALNVKAFNKTSRVYVQILKSESKPHILAAGIPNEHILCVEETKLNLLGQAIKFPGACVLVTNLVTSHSYKALSDAESDLAIFGIGKKLKVDRENESRTNEGMGATSSHWNSEYFHSLGQEIYCMHVVQDGFRYLDACLQSFKLYNVLIIGVMGPHSVPLLFPAHATLKVGDLVFVVAENEASVEQVCLWDSGGIRRFVFQSSDRVNSINVEQGKVTVNGPVMSSSSSSQTYRNLASSKALAAIRIRSQRVTPGAIDFDDTKVHNTATEARAVPEDLQIKRQPHGMTVGSQLVEKLSDWRNNMYNGLRKRETRRMAGRERILSALQLLSDCGVKSRSRGLVMKKVPKLIPKKELLPTTTRVVSMLTGEPTQIAPEYQAQVEFVAHKAKPKRVRGKRRRGQVTPTTTKDNANGGNVGETNIECTDAIADNEDRPEAESRVGETVKIFAESQRMLPGESGIHTDGSARSILQLTDLEEGRVNSESTKKLATELPESKMTNKERIPRSRQLSVVDFIFKAPDVESSTRETLHNLVQNHIVVICHRLRDLELLVARVRHKSVTGVRFDEDYGNDLQPVVILSPVVPSESIWRGVSRFGNVHFVLGSPHHWPDLLRAGISTAECCLVLGDPARNARNQNASADANVVLTCLIIETHIDDCHSNLRVVAELTTGDYICHLGVTTSWYAGNIGRRGNPLFRRMTLRKLSLNLASDKASESSIGSNNSLLSKGKLLMQQSTKNLKNEVTEVMGTAQAAEPSMFSDFTSASGNVLCETFMGSMLCQAFFNPHIIAIINALIGTADFEKHNGDEGFQTPEFSSSNYPSLHQMMIPKEQIGSTYGELFQHCLEEYAVLPFGLYRTEKENTGLFVYTNPPANCVILQHDRLFVISV